MNKIKSIAALFALLGTMGMVGATSLSLSVSPSGFGVFEGGNTNPIRISVSNVWNGLPFMASTKTTYQWSVVPGYNCPVWNLGQSNYAAWYYTPAKPSGLSYTCRFAVSAVSIVMQGTKVVGIYTATAQTGPITIAK